MNLEDWLLVALGAFFLWDAFNERRKRREIRADTDRIRAEFDRRVRGKGPR